MEYDSTGKLDLTGVYNRSNPVRYFSTLSALGYCVPQNAAPSLQGLIDARRAFTGRRHLRIIDIGCSYGVNAAFLKHGLTFDDLVMHYQSLEGHSRSAMLDEDATLFADPTDDDLEIVGLDTADRALSYAIEAGVLDDAAVVNLEAEDPSSDLRENVLCNADLVISTGCFGYISVRTLDRLLDCSHGSAPWMCHTVLRMFDFTDTAHALTERGYVTEQVEGLIRQRRFASEEEQDHVLARLARAGVNPIGIETDGWYYASIYVSRPAPDLIAASL